MKYLTSKQLSERWGLSDRSIREYCRSGRIPGAYFEGKTWMIPADAEKPSRQPRHTGKKPTLLAALRREKEGAVRGGIYQMLQIELTYNSNHMEGSKLTHEETRFIYETKTIGADGHPKNVDDIIETVNHFRCVDLAIDFAMRKLSESFIKQLHRVLKTGTSDAATPWFMVGDYKLLANTVGGRDTTAPGEVRAAMRALLAEYNAKERHTLEEIIAFHVAFERIHPFQDGNGRIGRLIMFKECLRNNIVPILVFDADKEFYYRGLKEWDNLQGYLIDTCLHGQDIVTAELDHFDIAHD